MMKKMLLVVLLAMAGSQMAWAESCPSVSGADTALVCVETVFNDSGSALTSGTVVAWDQDDSDFRTLGRPYILPSSTADDPYVAGVIQDASCPDQALCTIVTRGVTLVRVADSSDNAAVDTLIGGSATSGQAGDYATGANTCALGTLTEFLYGDNGTDNTLGRVFVNINCD